MKKEYFIELLEKHLQGKTTEEESRFLLDYYNLFQSDKDVLALMDTDKKEYLKTQINNGIWQNILEKEERKEGPAIMIKWIVRLAAAAVIIGICIGVSIFKAGDALPKNIAVNFSNTKKENKVVHLSDGSTVIVASGSRLSYPQSFNGLANREVFLEGEAFFDISHDPDHPFIVNTGKIKTTVLGTAFNIKAIEHDASIIITVKRGKVKISEQNKLLGLITQSQQIVYHKAKGDAVKKTVDIDADLLWKKQDLLLENVSVEEAAKVLEDKFDVKILVTDERIKTEKFTTVFLKNENLSQILTSICEFNDATYIYNKEKSSVIISRKTLIKI